MGRMNDVEKKKTLFQVLSRLRDVYTKLQLILEWTKVANEHLSLKAIKTCAIGAKDNLNRLINGLYYNSNSLLSRKHVEANFDAYKDLLLSPDQVPRFFSPSIETLSPAKHEFITEKDRKCWLSTLESLLRSEISKNMINISRKDCALLSIAEGRAKVLFLNLFEFEFTVVPIVDCDSLSPAWFVLGVSVDSMKELFKNSLTGIFQFKHNNVMTLDSEYFKTILTDCQKYVNLFYYEKLFSQFHFLSNSLGKTIFSFQKGPQGDWFKISSWFMEDESAELKVSITIDSKFIVSGSLPSQSLFIPSFSFDEDEAKLIFEKLFHEIYIKKLENFFIKVTEKDFCMNFELKSNFCYELLLFEDFKLKVAINPLSKRYKFDFISSIDVQSIPIDHLEESLIKFDYELFTEKITEIKREYLANLIVAEMMLSMDSMRNNDVSIFNVVGCPEVSSKTGICLHLKNTASCLSIDLCTKMVKFWKFSLNFNDGFLDIKFEAYEATKERQIPKTKRDLFELLEEEGKFLKGLTTKNSFETIIKKSGIEGEFETESSFKIYSFGLPTCINSVLLIGSEVGTISCNIEFVPNPEEQQSSKTIRVENESFNVLLRIIKNYIRLFTIWEESNLLEVTMEIDSLDPISLRCDKVLTISEDGGIAVTTFVGDVNCKDLEKFIESESFSIYEFLDRLVEEGPKDLEEKDNSPDLTWLSESFM